MLLPRPGRIDAHILRGGGCLADPPLFEPRFEGSGDFSPTMAAPLHTYESLRADVAAFAATLATIPNISAVAGVPRSGLLVASEIAIRLGLPLYSVGDGGLEKLSAGLRIRHVSFPSGRTLVVEDSSASGWSIAEARRRVGGDVDALFAAIYVTPSAAAKVDLYHKILPLPHWFEWNLWGNDHLMQGMKLGTDFDGILCADCPADADDDGDRYLDFLRHAPLLRRPGPHPIPTIITARLERYRAETEAWLERHGIRFGRLVMGPWQNIHERAGVCIGSWKAEQCDRWDVGLFDESCPTQARVISNRRPHPVLCPELGCSLVKGAARS